MSASNSEDAPASGVVELREDIPLKPSTRSGGGLGRYFVGIRFIVSCFAVLSVAITVALLTQLYYGDYELVPHGSVASDSALCSKAGTDTLKAGGGALDAAVAAALCMAVLSPHNTGLDAGGSLMLYEYKTSRAQGPLYADWSSPGVRKGAAPPAVPRLVAALAYLHARYGKLAWGQVVAPAALLARSGFNVTENLAAAITKYNAEPVYGPLEPNQTLTLNALADYFDQIGNKSSQDISDAAINITTVKLGSTTRTELGGFVLFTPPGQLAGAATVAALQQILASVNGGISVNNTDQLTNWTATALHQVLEAKPISPQSSTSTSAATNIAVADKDDVYVSLVSGLSSGFGSHLMSPDGYLLDSAPPPDLMPLILTENFTCGRRYVLGAGESSAAAQILANLVAGDLGLIPSVERPRFHLVPTGIVNIETDHLPAFSPATLKLLSNVGTLQNLTGPYPSCNVVEQQADDLASHADSRGGGLAYRF